MCSRSTGETGGCEQKNLPVLFWPKGFLRIHLPWVSGEARGASWPSRVIASRLEGRTAD